MDYFAASMLDANPTDKATYGLHRCEVDGWYMSTQWAHGPLEKRYGTRPEVLRWYAETCQ